LEPNNDASLTPKELEEIARARASFWAFLNVHFTTLPDITFVERLRASEFSAALDAVTDEAAEADVAPDMAAGASLMRDYLHSVAGTKAKALAEQLGVDRTRLYRGVAPNYGPPPPCEAVWCGRSNDTPAVLQEIAKIYAGNGMAISPDARERLDYIGVELEYQARLATREAEAWDAGDEPAARTLLKQQVEFLGLHLAQWVPAFIEKALTMAETDFYRGHLLMLRGFLASELERLKELEA